MRAMGMPCPDDVFLLHISSFVSYIFAFFQTPLPWRSLSLTGSDMTVILRAKLSPPHTLVLGMLASHQLVRILSHPGIVPGSAAAAKAVSAAAICN